MVSALFGFLTGFVGWLVSHLPLSPFRTLVLGWDGIGGYAASDLLAWVNWFVPFGDMLVLFQAWLAAALVFVAVKVLAKPVTRTFTGAGNLGN